MVRSHKALFPLPGGLLASFLVAILLLAGFGLMFPAFAAAGAPFGTGAISGLVFFDTNGDGLVGPAVSEQGIPAVTLQLLGSAPTLTTTTDTNGVYTFTGLAAGGYTVVEVAPAGYVTTTTNSKPVSVGSALVSGVNFGIAFPIEVRGIVCQDINPADGA